jgi:DNA replication protein DnaC
MRTITDNIFSKMAPVANGENPTLNIHEWAKFLEFGIDGDSRTQTQLSCMVEKAAFFIKALKSGNHPYWLTFLGTSGAGKTYLARKIWNWYRSSSLFRASIKDDEICYPGSWVAWPKLAGDLLNNSGYWQIDELQREKLVVLDEIGADRDPSGHVRDCLARVLSSRVGQWTVITSNKTLGDIQRDIDTRVSSRIIRDENVVVDVELVDYAIRHKAP